MGSDLDEAHLASNTYVDNSHFLRVIHVVNSQATLVDEVVETWVRTDQQFVCGGVLGKSEKYEAEEILSKSE